MGLNLQESIMPSQARNTPGHEYRLGLRARTIADITKFAADRTLPRAVSNIVYSSSLPGRTTKTDILKRFEAKLTVPILETLIFWQNLEHALRFAGENEFGEFQFGSCSYFAPYPRLIDYFEAEEHALQNGARLMPVNIYENLADQGYELDARSWSWLETPGLAETGDDEPTTKIIQDASRASNKVLSLRSDFAYNSHRGGVYRDTDPKFKDHLGGTRVVVTV